MMLTLTPEIVTVIAEHSRRAYPYECCGVLLGRFDPLQPEEALPGRNIAPENRNGNYLLDPQDFIAADRRADQRGLEVVGFYHSHPDQPAVPSLEDHAHAWPGYLYLIASVIAGRTVELRAWICGEIRSRPREVALAGSVQELLRRSS